MVFKDVTKNRKKVIYNSMVKSVLIFGAETRSLCDDDRRRINAAEKDALRRSAGISKLLCILLCVSPASDCCMPTFRNPLSVPSSRAGCKLDRKTNQYIREKMEAQDTILDEITRKQLISYGHVERMDASRLPKIMINWKPEGRKKRCRPRRTCKDGMYDEVMSERDLRMGEKNNRGRLNVEVGRHRQMF